MAEARHQSPYGLLRQVHECRRLLQQQHVYFTGWGVGMLALNCGNIHITAPGKRDKIVLKPNIIEIVNADSAETPRYPNKPTKATSRTPQPLIEIGKIDIKITGGNSANASSHVIETPKLNVSAHIDAMTIKWFTIENRICFIRAKGDNNMRRIGAAMSDTILTGRK